jgi:transcriptional regulator with XRE-family HTH domain
MATRPRSAPAQRYVFGQRLQALLAEADLTQSELARRIGADPSTVNRYIKGTQEPTIANLRAIRLVLHCSWSRLLD